MPGSQTLAISQPLTPHIQSVSKLDSSIRKMCPESDHLSPALSKPPQPLAYITALPPNWFLCFHSCLFIVYFLQSNESDFSRAQVRSKSSCDPPCQSSLKPLPRPATRPLCHPNPPSSLPSSHLDLLAVPQTRPAGFAIASCLGLALCPSPLGHLQD